MTPDNARRVANGILIAAGAALVILVWRQPRVRQTLTRLAPLALGDVRPVHVVAAVAALASTLAESEGAAPSRSRERPPRTWPAPVPSPR